MSSFFGVGGCAFRTIKDRTILVDTIAFPAYRRELVARAGPFDEELIRNQDDEYNYRIRGFGGRILLVSDARSRYFARPSLGKLATQYFQYGFWKVRVMQKHPAQMKTRQFVPPLFVTALLFSALSALLFRWGTVVLETILGLYAAGSLAATFSSHPRLGVRGRLLLPAVYATLHMSYGLGFLNGLIRFADRWGDRGSSRCLSDQVGAAK
jgi:hypothetical protein